MAVSKSYSGQRTIDGLVVTVDGDPLDPNTDIKQYTPYGFEWSYEGDAPQQLAFAILVDFFNDKDKAIGLSKPFMEAVIANFDNDWELSAEQITSALAEFPGQE